MFRWFARTMDPGFAWYDPKVAHIRWGNNVARGRDDRCQGQTKARFVEGGTIGPART